MVVTGQANNSLTPSISDTLNSGWSSCYFFTSTFNLFMFWAVVPAGGGANTITIGNNAAADYLGYVILEYSVDTGYTVHIDQHPAGTSGAASATPTTPQITTTVASEMIVAGFGQGGNDWATAAPLTQRGAVTLLGGTYMVVGDDAVTSIQTNQTWSATQTSNPYHSIVASFYETAPAAGGGNNRLMMMGFGT